MLHHHLTRAPLLLILQLTFCFALRKMAEIGENQRKCAYTDGHFIIGALFPVHEEPLLGGNKDPLKCGKIRELYGIQRVKAALLAVDIINSRKYIPGITLGINIRDECWSESLALFQTMNLIDTPTPWDDPLFQCMNSSEPRKPTFIHSPLIGIIGPSSSTSTMYVQNMLKLFKIPQISYSASSTTLFHFNTYPYFLSVVPPVLFQVKIILSILQQFNWTYISIVHIDNAYGQGGVTDMKSLSPEFKICIAKTVPIPPSSSDKDHYDKGINHLLEDERAKVVVCFLDVLAARQLLKAVKRNNVTGKFLFVGSDGWSAEREVVESYEEQAAGSIIIDVNTKVPEELREFIREKNVTDERNPWYKELWEYKFGCTFNNTDNFTQLCTGDEELTDNEELDRKVFYVMKSVFAFADGLKRMQVDLCKNESGPCNAMYPFNSTKFMEHLREVETGDFIYYGDSKSIAPLRNKISYDVFNFQKNDDGTFDYVNIGTAHGCSTTLKRCPFDKVTFTTELRNNSIQFLNGTFEPIQSNCSSPCLPGYRQDLQSNDPEKVCCWSCVRCENNEIVSDVKTCTPCDRGFWPNPNKTDCVKVPELYVHWTDLQSVVSLSLSIIGITFTTITSIIFWKYRETPVVKSSTRELCYLMLGGMLLVHSAVFVFTAKPSFVICTVARLVHPLSFTIIYASLLVKTNRIARLLAISKKKFPNPNPPFMTLKAQIIITAALVGVEFVVCSILLLEEPPIPYKVYNEPHNIQILCPTNVNIVMTPFVFIGILIVMCTVYAIKTRKLPGNFNEAKFIGFAMYAGCITWTAFIFVYFGGDAHHVIAIATCSFTNSMIILVFLFFPKLYIMIWAPERNTRINFTTTNGIRCIIGRQEAPQNYPKKTLYFENDFIYMSDLNMQIKMKSTFTQTEPVDMKPVSTEINENENHKVKIN